MKIPETSANVGAYYGNEEQNGQWQSSQQYMVMSPHGMVIDVNNVGSGDHSAHRPPMYHHPGYVIPGGYYGGGPYPPAGVPVPADDFADYMWMENEDEFDKQVMQQLEEEALMEQCIEAMLEDEQRERLRPAANCTNGASSTSSISLEEAVSRSTLNPLAAEFVPTFVPSTAKTQEDKQESPPESSPTATVTATTAQNDTGADQSNTSNHTEPTTHDTTPEVSAAGIEVDNTKTKKTEGKKTAKPKSPPVKEVKSEPKIAPKKKETSEAKPVKSESAVLNHEVNRENSENVDDSAVFAVGTKPQPAEESTGPKPINYAAAAKANKKKSSTPPAVDKPASVTKVQESKLTERKPAQKPEKPVQRKNSAK